MLAIFVVPLDVDHGCWHRYGLRTAEETATAPSVASPRADDRRYGPGCCYAPRRPTGTEDSQGRGGSGARAARRPRGTEASTLGSRPAPFAEVAGPQRSGRTVRHSAGDAPLQVVPALRGDDGVDGTTLRFLLEQNLSLKKKQEEEEKERELKEKKAQKVKREEKLLELEARQRAVSRELDPSPGPVRASLGPGRRKGCKAPNAATLPRP